MMNDAAALAGMLPYDTIGLYEQPKPRFIFKMPRVVPDQKSKFESDELFRRLSRESEVSKSHPVRKYFLLCLRSTFRRNSFSPMNRQMIFGLFCLERFVCHENLWLIEDEQMIYYRTVWDQWK